MYASPVATPGPDVRLRTSPAKRRAPEPVAQLRVVDADLLEPSRRHLGRRLAADIREPALEPAHAGLARVLADDGAQQLVGQRQLRTPQAVGLELLREEVALRDPELLVLGVARELDHVHAVEQRAGDRVQRVRGADEQHLREIERQVEVVVAERAVLLGVEHLEHRARGVAAPVRAHLVDLVDQDQRVRRLRVADRADDRAGHRADVRAAVAADLGLVAHTADREAHELPSERVRDRVAERRLADTGRADEAEDLAGDLVAQLRDGEVLDDPVLHLLEVEVVGVEHLARVRRDRGCRR